MSWRIDRKFRYARIWSNGELKKISHLFTGSVVNVSGWKDIDKEGNHYKEYFFNASSYSISNYKAEARGLQGYDNEFYLDLEEGLDPKYHQRFDVAFNHTTLEHIYNYQKAFSNICRMSRDIVIIVVPFLQQAHADYGDYWRFTPMALIRMFEDEKMNMLYINANEKKNTSVYIFAVACKSNPEKWNSLFDVPDNKLKELRTHSHFIGKNAITNSLLYRLGRRLGFIK